MLSDTSIKRDKKKCALPRRILLKARELCGKRKRRCLNANLSEKLKDCKFTVFSNNCLGTVFYHDAGKEFTSPLINTAMDGEDFLRFIERPKYYLSREMQFIKYKGYDYPIAMLDDVEIRFVHYKSEEEAKNKFYERAKRIVWDNVFIIATNHDGMNKPQLMARFDKLPYQNKIMYVSNEYPEYQWAKLVPQFKGRFQVRIMTSFANFRGQRYYETAFNLAEYVAKRCK